MTFELEAIRKVSTRFHVQPVTVCERFRGGARIIDSKGINQHTVGERSTNHPSAIELSAPDAKPERAADGNHGKKGNAN